MSATIKTGIYGALAPLVQNRCYTGWLPQDLANYPAINYLEAGGRPLPTIAPRSEETKNELYQVHIWGKDFAALVALVESARSALYAQFAVDGFAIEQQDERDEPDTDERLFRTILTFSIWQRGPVT